jgi:Ni/Co efflux regulator RcnB
MRNALLTTALLFCLATASMAADQKKAAQAESKQTQQTQMARNDADRSMDHASSVKGDCVPQSGGQFKDLQDRPEGDPEAPQNPVEYGGGG